MKKNTALIVILLAAFLLVANLIIVYEGMQAGITKWGNVCGVLCMVFVIASTYYKQKKGKE
ncbi:MAG: hypothetical protein IJV36_03360 [Prevotella sp.]|nr:hypothetical protein [Prevotella sp.]